MDVPFHSSGAISRAHYAIVRKVESAPSVEAADQHIFLEVKSIQAQLSHPKLHFDKCKECLVILLYCSMSVTPGFLGKDAFDFAFHHAITLTETGRKVEDKRLGYLFCSEMIPLDHDLRLMLINTLRKDLESEDVPYICLALDNLISSPNEDVIPAVQSRLHDLLSHDYSHVKRRALLAFRSLSIYNRTLLDRIHGNVLNLLQDSDDSVVHAALVLASDFPKDNALSNGVNEILRTEASLVHPNQGLILSSLKSLQHLGAKAEDINVLFDVLLEIDLKNPKSLKSLAKAIVLDLFKLFGQLAYGVLLQAEKSKATSTVQYIRHFLTSTNPDEVYLFVSCLENVDVALWAGTSQEHPAVLDALEFERIMQLLNSLDQDIRRKTLRIVNKVDPAILDSQISLLLSSNLNATLKKDASIMRALEIASVRYQQKGEEYASQVLGLLRLLDNAMTTPQVFKGVIETVLTDARASPNPDFLASCANRFIDDLMKQDVTLGPTALVIATALSTEFSATLPVPAPQLLSALAMRLKLSPVIVQEPCLIAMIRIRAECDEVPSDVIEAVRITSQSARRSITLLCDQFQEFLQNKSLLMKIVNISPSSSLPDFLASLQFRSRINSGVSRTTPQDCRSSSRTSRPSTSLKYTPYEPPEAVPRLSARRMSSSQQSASTSRSGTLSDIGHHRSPPRSVIMPITAGRLALVDGLPNLQIRQEAQLSPPSKPTNSTIEPETSRVDLINLESPYPTDMSTPLESSDTLGDHQNFEDLWTSFQVPCDLRGWCNASIDTLLRRLQRLDNLHLRVISADLPPFIGELKILIDSNEGTNSELITLRLRESEEDSCLWRLRCASALVGEPIQAVLNT
ncbi:hypothetical protein GALMADRAFT_140851 [Galerina marginata CBS 339.88]|uniref:Clathrin/coatomer adaptor adaptin-like N-terminal domain-containing protein n=1 Tax=Galerina marginata (strain CBS 339.88) TaxID=685588 RepID=A0A067SWL8_GALM3|nr:hypothetical protein GALMADRAFT_140851 [Galerina marginata CBS 339.88]